MQEHRVVSARHDDSLDTAFLINHAVKAKRLPFMWQLSDILA